MIQKSLHRNFIDFDERENPLMTPKTVKYYCDKEDLPEKTQDVDVLYLQYQAFQKIIPQTLDLYTNLKILHLNNNRIKKIEGLSSAKGLTHLYLNNNYIQRIQGLEDLSETIVINLAHNKLDLVEGLGHLKKLKILNLAENFFINSKDIFQLPAIISLSQLNLSQNDLQASQQVLEIVTQLKGLTHLFLKSTPISTNLKNYRKKIISKLPNLILLDSQAVFPMDHLLAQAWALGGPQKQAELKKTLNDQIDKKKLLTNQKAS